MAFKLDGKTLAPDRSFSANGVNYPSNWLRLSSSDEKKAIGITEVADPVPEIFDSRFYTSKTTARPIDGLKTDWLKIQKKEADSYLSATDCYVIRKADKGTAIPDKIETHRNSIRSVYETRKTEISYCTSTDALQTLITTTITAWPRLELE